MTISLAYPCFAGNKLLRWTLSGTVNGLYVSLPFASRIGAQKYAEKMGWNVVTTRN